MAIRRISGINSKYAHDCLNCSGKLARLKNGGTAKCPLCGTVHLVKITENNNVILTDKRYKKLFEEKKNAKVSADKQHRDRTNAKKKTAENENV